MSLLDGIRGLAELELANQRVFVRVDFNVPLDGDRVTDDTRIREALPTLQHIVDAGARVVIGSHLGRPKPGKHEGLSLEPIGARLSELTGWEVHLPDDCVGDGPRKVVRDLRAGQVCLLENLRFHAGEEKDDEAFARRLAELCDVYVDDAFGACHRAHASVHALPRLMRDRGCGLLMQKEIAALGRLVAAPERPYVAVLGGAKVSDKLAVVEALLAKIDALCIGGAMANTFLAAKGFDMQASRVEVDQLPLARTLLEKARERGVDMLLPTDVVVASSFGADAGEIVDVAQIPAGAMALDIGPRTVERFAARFASAATIFWNGPMGLFEKAPFAAGTLGVATAMSAAPGFTVVGGGDSAAAVATAGEAVAAGFKHISTGGGASLELLEGRKLPGIEALRTAEIA